MTWSSGMSSSRLESSEGETCKIMMNRRHDEKSGRDDDRDEKVCTHVKASSGHASKQLILVLQSKLLQGSGRHKRTNVYIYIYTQQPERGSHAKTLDFMFTTFGKWYSARLTGISTLRTFMAAIK